MKREIVYVNLNTKFGQVFTNQEIKFEDQGASSEMQRYLNEVFSLSE